VRWKWYFAFLLAVMLADDIAAPRASDGLKSHKGDREHVRAAPQTHHFYLACDVTWQVCRIA
jgi:hypothetical protein